jgi:hypothetical protein
VRTSLEKEISMAYVPYTPDLEAWKKHFVNYAPSRLKKFYTLKNKQQGEGAYPNIKLVSPTEQFVEQAKAQLKMLKPAATIKRKHVKRSGKKVQKRNSPTKKRKPQKRKSLKNVRGKKIR